MACVVCWKVPAPGGAHAADSETRTAIRFTFHRTMLRSQVRQHNVKVVVAAAAAAAAAGSTRSMLLTFFCVSLDRSTAVPTWNSRLALSAPPSLWLAVRDESVKAVAMLGSCCWASKKTYRWLFFLLWRVAAIAKNVRVFEQIALLAVGPSSVNQCIKAISIACRYCEEDNLTVAFRESSMLAGLVLATNLFLQMYMPDLQRMCVFVQRSPLHDHRPRQQ